MEITEIMAWQATAILECALVLWLVAKVLRVRYRLLRLHTIYLDINDNYAQKAVACSRLKRSLREIVSLDTPKAAHGVKKAVKIATEALGQ